jgi:hypothetical protein
MPPAELRRWLRRSPFQPFRMHILEATSYEVKHPELVVVHLATADCFISAPGQTVPIGDWGMTIALPHITRLEPLSPPGPSGNGQAG